MIRDYVVRDGRLCPAPPVVEQPLHLYQILHVERRSPCYLREHIEVLDRASQQLFRRSFRPEVQQVEEEVHRLLDALCLRREATHFVRIELFASGERMLRYAGTSLYDGYALRSLRPAAVTVRYDLPTGEYPTSLGEEAARWALHAAEQRGARCAVHCDGRGILLTADNAPLVAIQGETCCLSPAPESLERLLARECIRAAGLTLRETPILHDQLSRFDELLYIDHRGITSLASCDGRPYMNILTDRLARVLDQF